MNAINRFRIFLLSSFVLLSSTVFPHSFVYAGDDASLSEMHWRRSRDSGVKSFDWWPTDAAPQPAPDGRPGRNGSWWWPEIPGQIWPLWGNRGFPYVLKTISTAVTQKLSKEKTEERISETSEVLPLQAEKVSEPSLASEAFSSKGEGGAKRDCWLCFDWGLHAGYRVDDFRWSTAGNTQGTNPDILTESTWRNLDIYQMQLDGELLVHKSYVLKGLLSHGWIFDGKNRTSEYSGNNRTSETRRWDSESNEGTILDLSGALGYRLKPWERFSLTPLAGYSYHEQNFKLIRPPASIPDLDSTYEAQWWGPWAGADLAYRPDKRNTFFLNFEYHWAKYEAEADWNLRGGNLAHPKSFEHSADAEGVVVRAGWAYALNKRWSTRLTLGVQDWETRSGTETTFFGNGTTGNTRLNKVEWDSFEVMAGFHYNLDERCAGWEEEELGEMGEAGLTGDRIKLSGKYRLSGGIGDEAGFILNDSNADLQERNWRYVFGERLNNTYDPSVYSQYLLNVDFSPLDKVNIFTQIVADPWSYVGTTGDQVVISRIDSAASLRYNLKYFGAFNSTLNEIYRTPNTDSVSIPIIKVHNGHLAGGTVVRGFNDYNPATNGVPFVIPEHEVDFEFRPIRKLWVDAKKEENWRLRVFALADENQALTTDDPLELSNHKQYWQQSPWLHQYKPIQFFTDRSIKRGYYSDALSFLARDSQGNRLVLLRGASFEGNFDKTYLVSTVAAPFTPWDEEFFSADNVPGAVRMKHQATDQLMVGSTYTFRNGLINNSIADSAQVLGVDAEYKIDRNVTLKGEAAGSYRDRDLLTDERIRTDMQGFAYKGVLRADFDHKLDGHTDFQFSYTQMDRDFEPSLSRYFNTRDDIFWGKHLTFTPAYDLEPFRIGDGVDVNRFVFRVHWKEKLFKERFFNLFDVRNVHRTNNTAYIETVLRDELTYQVTPQLTGKGLFRWHGLPKTTRNVEPFISNYYFSGDLVDATDRNLFFQNTAIPEGRDPSRFTYSGGLQYIVNKQWTLEGFYERTNDLPDFPRGLLFDVFRDANTRVDGLLIDRLQGFYYGQGPLGGVPPYEYFSIVRERVIFKPDPKVTVTFHAAQNGYKFAGGIDDNITHQGVSVTFDVNEKLKLFADYTHSKVIDLPKLVATNYGDSDNRDHQNVYASMDYRLNSSQVFRAEYGVFGLGTNSPQVTPYSTTGFSLPTLDTEHLLRVSLTGDF